VLVVAFVVVLVVAHNAFPVGGRFTVASSLLRFDRGHWSCHNVRVVEPGANRVEPPLSDPVVVVNESDYVAGGDLDTSVAGDVDRAVGDLHQHVHVVAVPHHPGGAVGGGAVSDDHLRLGGVGRQRVETGG